MAPPIIQNVAVENSFDFLSNGLFTNVGLGAMGNGGNLIIETDNLTLTEGGKIVANTFGKGNAGDIFIRANNLEVKDTIVDSLGSRSGINSTVERQGIGNGGNIDIFANNLSLIDGGLISVDTMGQGNAGNIKINSQNINIAGVSSGEPISNFQQPKLPSQISAFSEGDFDAGSININTKTLQISDRGLIAVSNLGHGNSGNLNISAGELNLDRSATLEANVNVGNRGNINLTTDNIFLRNNSEINAKASGTATGGNIAINNQNNIVLLENSQIIADAFQGNGGKINIATQGLFVSSNSLITAKSQFALDGTVDIDKINSDRHLESNRLPENTIDPNSRITSSCSTSNQNTFSVTGNGGVTNSPYATQSLNATWYDLRPVPEEEINLASVSKPLTEANTTIINDQGKLELIALTPLSTSRWVKSSCTKSK
jgi:large exoprotein involved in heme utilization and adhesion